MYCVIDIGSNTIRLVIYRVEDNAIKPMLNNKVAEPESAPGWH